MSNSHDKDGWSNDSASLFREARRAHDPTLAESARLGAVLARIQAGKAEASFDANHGADIVARGATSGMLRLVASLSVGVLCIAAASFVFMQVKRDRPEPARNAKPAPAAVTSTPPPNAMQPVPVPSGELGASARASAARDEAQPRPRRQQRPSRATAERQRTSRIEMDSVPEASSSDLQDNSPSVTVPENGATRYARPEPTNTVKADAVIQEAAPRATSVESHPQETVTTAAREADQTLPEDARTELAMIKRIQGALRDADFSTVLDMCEEHARRWPHGMFELEREGVRAIASCGEKSDDAELRAKRFLTAHPHAPVAMRVSASCAAQLKKR